MRYADRLRADGDRAVGGTPAIRGWRLAVGLLFAVIALGLGAWLLLPVELAGGSTASRWNDVASGTALPWALIILGSSAATMMPIGRLGPRMAAGSLATAAFIVIGVGFTAGDLNEALYGARHAPPGSVLLTYWLSLAFGASLILGWSLPARPGTGGRVLIPIGLVCVGLALWIAAATADVEGPAGILPLIVILTVLGSGLICLVGGGYRLGRATARPGD